MPLLTSCGLLLFPFALFISSLSFFLGYTFFSTSLSPCSVYIISSSLRGRRLKGKRKGVLGARETRGALPPSSRAPRVFLAPKTPFPFPSKRPPRRLNFFFCFSSLKDSGDCLFCDGGGGGGGGVGGR